MTKDEALKLALEAFEYIEHNYMSLPAPATKAITAIKEALAQPEQDWIERERAVGYREGHQNALKQMAQPEKEPVACDCDSLAWCKQYKKCNRTMLGFMPYVAQPTWVEIDGDDWNKALEMADFDKVAAFEFFENKIKELNT
jgi:hypothetical protein